MSERPWYLGGRGISLLIRLWRASVRLEVRNRKWQKPPFVLAVWHGRIFGVLMDQIGSRCVTMASQSEDGALAAGIVEGLGLRAARGSSSRGGREALRDMREMVLAGAPYAALTVDGPRGPWRQVKGGILVLARRLEIPILPATFSCSRPKLLRSWDRGVLPRPFSRVVVTYGEPWPADRLNEDGSGCASALGVALDELTMALDREVAGRELWPARETLG